MKLMFDKNNAKTPKSVFEKYVNIIKNNTKGYVEAHVEKYDGPIESFEMSSPIKTLSLGFDMAPKTIDIQKKLGEQNEFSFKYEFFLSSRVMEKYKYRILFIQYDINFYPVKLVMQQSIADEIRGEVDSDYVFYINSEDELSKIINSVVNTRTLLKIMQSIINVELAYQEIKK